MISTMPSTAVSAVPSTSKKPSRKSLAEALFRSKYLSDLSAAGALRRGPVLRRRCPVTFPTHPNAPFVVNYFEVIDDCEYHNGDRMAAKYATAEGAEWLCQTMNRTTSGRKVWYIVE